MSELPRFYFDGGLPPIYESLIEGRAVAVGPDDADLATAQAVIAGAARPWNAAAFALAPQLVVISRTGVGYDNVDVADALAAGVTVCHTPLAPMVSTAEHTIALLLAITKGLPAMQARAVQGLAGAGPQPSALELDGCVLGLVGFGRIARRVATAATGLGMQTVAFDPFLDANGTGAGTDVALVPLAELLAAADVVTLHAPATPDTHRIMNEATFAAMKPGAYLVNCARGALVDHDALLDALDSGHLAGAALDVTDPEPLPVGHRLLDHPRAIVTPHVASATTAGRYRLYEHAVENALAVLRGDPATTVPPPS